ncbi:TlpA family protein disulfide reductase [Labilithrix luteola]|nr:TlpA disulfide reductase family protein [Labilithrix luteola]
MAEARLRGFLAGLSVVALVSVAAVGCGPKAPEGPPIGMSDKPGLSAPMDRPLTYEFDSLDDRVVSSGAMVGKPTVIVFIQTGDLDGQAQVDYLVAMAKNDHDKVNYVLVALHPRKEIVLVEAYAKTLGVEFPVALGDGTVTGAAGPFGPMPAVPTTVILARDGRMVWKHTGIAKSDELRSHMRGL